MFKFLDELLWALVGVIVARILDRPIERIQRKAIYRIKGVISRVRKLGSVAVSPDEFRIGQWHVGWNVIEGSSSDPYTPNNVICQFDPTPLVLSADRQLKKQQIEESQAKLAKANGSRLYHNGPTLALAGFARGQIGDMEESLLILRVRPSDYYTFLATAMSLDETIRIEHGKTTTVREKYLCNIRYDLPVPEFASALAVNLTVITSDGFIIVSKRAPEVSGYAGYLSPAINECVNPASDRGANGTISLLATAQRGASYELNIEITESEVVFFTLGVDTRWYYYGVTGLIRSKSFSKDDIRTRQSLGSKEHWEASEYYFLPHDPDQVAKFMSKYSKIEKWNPIGVVCLVQTLVLEFGIKTVERLLRKYPLHLKT